MKVAIIGNGVSGITAARWIRKLGNHQISVISSESDYFFSRTALMYVYMGHMKFDDIQPYEPDFWLKNRIDLVKDRVKQVVFDEKKLILESSEPIVYDKLIFALGSKSNMFGWPGQDLNGVGGLYALQDLQNMEAFSSGLERAVVVGGGLIGIEMAEMFHSRKIPVTMLVRESDYWNNVLPPEESAMISRHIVKHGIDLRLNSNLGEIIDDGDGKACAVVVKETGDKVNCGYVGLTAGVSPNVDFLKNSSLEVERGIMVDDYLRTNIGDVYAIGDCAQIREAKPGRKNIEAVWYTGRMMGEVVAHNVCGNKIDYDPGIWFNSAKFIDIEYQVYGDVPQESNSIYWEHSCGEKSIRIVYDQNTQIVTGLNLMGIRFRHEVCEKWLASKAKLEDVLENICLADFNPEFYETYEKSLISQYNESFGKELVLKSKRSLNSVLSFLKQ